MNRMVTLVIVLATVVSSALAQQQPGLPAKMSIVGSSKTIPVFVQRIDNGHLVFQLYRQTRNLSGPVGKIAYLDFITKLNTDEVEKLYTQGDFQGMINTMKSGLKPSLDAYWPYMQIDNNLQDLFCKLTDAYLDLGDYTHATQAAQILQKSKNHTALAKGQSVAIMIALKQGKIDDAVKMLDQIDSPAGKLYFKACIDRARKKPKVAMQSVTEIIAKYANDLDWMPKAELLSAKLYEDMAATQPDPYIDSAIYTARQVKHIYANSHIAALAGKLQKFLEAKKAKAEAEAKAKADAEAKAKAKVRERAEERAKAALKEETGDNSTTTNQNSSIQSGTLGKVGGPID